MRVIQKQSAEALRLERILSKYEARVRREFMAYVNAIRSDAVLRQIADMLERGDLSAAMLLLESHIAKLAAVLPAVFAAAGVEYADEMAREFRKVSPTVAISFDPSFPRAAELSRQNQLRFIREFTESQRAAVRMALEAGFREGWGARRLANEFRDVIGLTDRQERAVQNYRRLLQGGPQTAVYKPALQVDLRDRRYDRLVRRSRRDGEPLTPEQIDRMVSRYRQRYLAYRAETIARTEAGRAAALAQEEALEQAISATGLTRDRVRRVWRTANDARVRDTHSAMNGQERGKGEAFSSLSGAELRFPRDPRGPASEVVNCRCSVAIKILPPE